MKLPEKIYLTVPTSWAELDDHQLYYIFGLFADNLSSAQIKAYCFFTWSGTKLLCRYGDGYLAKRGKEEFTLTSALVASAIHALDWVDVLPDIPVRISKIKGAKAAEPTLVGFAFERYLYCENIYQGYLQTQQHHLLNEMAHLLYDSDKITPNQAEKIGIFYWWMGLKSYYARQFPHFFQSVSDNANLLHANSNRPPSSAELQQAMNAQIRALTKGDVTKESQILAMDTWRALVELDAQAREYEEINQTMKK